MTRAESLRAFIGSWDRVPVVDGQSDCSIVPALWAAEITGLPIEWPDYSSADEAAAMIEDAGGLDHLWRDVARGPGFREYHAHDVPSLGDIGIVNTRTRGPIGGIFVNHGVIMVRCDPRDDAPRGMRPLTWTVRSAVAAWVIP